MNKKLLVMHQGALGDLILCFPALLSLKREHDAAVSLVCRGGPGRLAQWLGVVDAHFEAEGPGLSSIYCDEMAPGARKFINGFDAVILFSLSDSLHQRLVKNHHGNVYRIDPRPAADDETHVAVYILNQLRARQLVQGAGGIFPLASDTVSVSARRQEGLCNRERERLIAVHPGAGSPRKRWPVERFMQVADTIMATGLGRASFMVGPAERDLAQQIRNNAKEGIPVHEVDEVAGVIAVMRQAIGFVGNDSGITHLAAFMGVPTVAIFGPSSPARWAPVGSFTRVLRGSDCPACFETAKQNCETPECLYGVSPDKVIGSLTGMLQR